MVGEPTHKELQRGTVALEDLMAEGTLLDLPRTGSPIAAQSITIQ
jgi:hypothetical protein